MGKSASLTSDASTADYDTEYRAVMDPDGNLYNFIVPQGYYFEKWFPNTDLSTQGAMVSSQKVNLSKGHGMIVDATAADYDIKYTGVYDNAGPIPSFMVPAGKFFKLENPKRVLMNLADSHMGNFDSFGRVDFQGGGEGLHTIDNMRAN